MFVCVICSYNIDVCFCCNQLIGIIMQIVLDLSTIYIFCLITKTAFVDCSGVQYLIKYLIKHKINYTSASEKNVILCIIKFFILAVVVLLYSYFFFILLQLISCYID